MATGSPDRRRLPAGIRLRATVVATVVVALALALGGALLVLLVNRSLVGSVDAANRARAHDVAALASAGRLQGSVASTGEDSSVVQVITTTGQVLAASPNIEGQAVVLVPPARSHSTFVTTLERLPIQDSSQPFRLIAEPVALPTGPGWVLVATSLAQVSVTTARVAVLLAAGLPLLLLIVAAVTWRAVGRALAPVELIRAGAAAISGTDSDARLPVPPVRDEIGRLAQTMNDLLARISTAAQQQRQFVGDASHELRSPLAALQTEIDVARQHPSGEPSEAVLARLSDQMARFRELTDNLLFLARADEGAESLRDEAVDLDELVLAEVHRLRGLGHTVLVDLPTAARVHGSASDLSRLLRNLGDNAAEHARSTVWISLRVEASHALLAVRDDGPGIPQVDRERVFDRFVRLDAARARTASGSGSGLGLAICRQIVQRHHGTISIHDGPGALVVTRLPLIRPKASRA